MVSRKPAFVLALALLALEAGAQLPESLRPYLEPSCRNLLAKFSNFATDPARPRWSLRRWLTSLVQDTPSRKESKELNQKLLNALLAASTGFPADGKKAAIDFRAAQAIYDSISRHPILSNEGLRRYRPYRKEDFCWGLAAGVHWEATQNHGVDSDAVLKLWALGNWKAVGWHYHVTTLVKSSGPEGYWAIDPSWEKPLPVSEWYARMHNMNIPDHNMLLTLSSADRVMTHSDSTFENVTVASVAEQTFYRDLLRYYGKSATTGR